MQQYLHNDFATSQPLVLRAPTPALSRRAGYHMESQVPSPNMEAKSQLLSLKEPHWMRILVLLCTHICRQDLCWELGLAYCSTQFSTQVSSLTSNKQCHVGIHVILLRLRTWETSCEVVSPNFHALHDWDCTLCVLRLPHFHGGPVHMEAKSQLLSLKEPHWMRILVLLCTHICRQDLCWELGLAYCSTQFSTQVSNLTSNKQCHVVIHVILLRLRTWDLLWSGKSQLSCSPRLRFHRLTKSDMGLRTSYPHVNRSLTPNFASLWEGCFECISLINKFWG